MYQEVCNSDGLKYKTRLGAATDIHFDVVRSLWHKELGLEAPYSFLGQVASVPIAVMAPFAIPVEALIFVEKVPKTEAVYQQ